MDEFFFFQIDRHFELLNYSEYGTKVDSVVYSCDVNDKPATTPKVSPLVASVREVVKKKKGKKSKEESNKEENYEGIKNLDEENKLKMSARNNEVSHFVYKEMLQQSLFYTLSLNI